MGIQPILCENNKILKDSVRSNKICDCA